MNKTIYRMSSIYIGIIGPAGRGLDYYKMTKDLFNSMVSTAKRIIQEQLTLDYKDITLVSGGAAWSG